MGGWCELPSLSLTYPLAERVELDADLFGSGVPELPRWLDEVLGGGGNGGPVEDDMPAAGDVFVVVGRAVNVDELDSAGEGCEGV